MSQNNTFNNNQSGAPSYGQQPYGQQSPYGQPQQQAYNQQMTYQQPQPYGQQPPRSPQPVGPNQPSGGNNKTPIIIGAIAAGVIIIGLIVALIVILNKDKGTETASTEATTRATTEEARITTEEITEAPTEAPTEEPTEAPTEAPTEEPTEAPTEEPTEAPTEADNPAPAPGGTVDGLSDDIYSEQIAINGTVYHLPFDYDLISDQYTFDMADYGHDDNYLLNPGDKVTSTIYLQNPNMDDRVDFCVGFMNTGSEAAPIKETDVWAVDFDIAWAKSTDYPSVVLPKGITWGSTLEEVKAAYGEPTDEPYYADSLGYWEYEYEDEDLDFNLRLTIYDDKGVTGISLKSYKAD